MTGIVKINRFTCQPICTFYDLIAFPQLEFRDENPDSREAMMAVLAGNRLIDYGDYTYVYFNYSVYGKLEHSF